MAWRRGSRSQSRKRREGRIFDVIKRIGRQTLIHLCMQMDKLNLDKIKSKLDKNASIQEPRRSGWAAFFTVIGVILLIISVILAANVGESGLNFFHVIVFFGAGLQALLFGFLINVFTDIRWYLKQIAEKNL